MKNISEPIAIVGVGGVFPGSADIPSFWKNILDKVDSIIEVPKDSWDWKLYYDANPAAPDKTYSKIGGFVRDFHFDPLKLRIPPPVAQQMDMVQKLAVAATAEALKDSGYDKKKFNPERTAVVLGNSMGGTKKEATDLRVYSAFFKSQLSGTAAFSKLPSAARETILSEMEQGVKACLSTITEDTMPGELSNVIAGRVANTFNFNGANFTVDAACASSLAALDQAVKGLRAHDFDMVFCGGVDQMMSPPAYVKFCKIGALSPDGSRPFDAGANGFVMGEGVGVCALKRLSDALRDGDRIYALVRAVGSSSDGRGKGITAPNPKGQRLAIERAFEQVDYAPGDVGLVEAHGTSTKVGDVVEANTLSELFKGHAAPQSIGLGSVKSQIGHLKAAAGVASLIKTALALYHKTLPPSINFRTPNPGVDWNNSPFFVVPEPREWKSKKTRRANVSSFGFGGTNFHVAMEEAGDEALQRWSAAAAAARARGERQASTFSTGGAIESESAGPSSLLNAKIVPGGEAFFIHGASPEAVFDRLSAIASKIPGDAAGLNALAADINHHGRSEYNVCFAAESPEKLREKIDFILKSREKGAELWASTPPLYKPKGIYFGRRKKPGKVGLMFPGQGSQYVDMLKDLKEKYPVVAQTFAQADEIMQEVAGYRLTGVLFTRGGETPEQIAAMEEKIKQTEITQPAVLTADIAMLRLLKTFGVEPDVVCGHSLGEYGAIVASGILDFKEALLAVSARAKEMAGVQVPDKGKMASIAAPASKVEPVLKEIKGYVAPANKNCPIQTVIAGESRSVEAAIAKFNALGITAQEIRVSHAFHSKIVAPGQAPYRKFLERMNLAAPKIPVLSNVTAAYYPDSVKEIRELMVQQIASPVEFIRQIERMYKDGVRLFVEAGPKRVLTAFVTSTLENKKDAAALSSNHPKRGGIVEFNDLIARLTAEGVDLTLPEVRSTQTGDTLRVSPEYSVLPRPVAGTSLPSSAPLEQPRAAESELAEKWGFYTGPVVVSGVAAGTPGAWDRVFKKDSIDQILRGQNLIGKLSEKDVQSQIEKNIVRLIKSATGDHRLERIENAAEVVQLAALAGEFDLAKEFGFKESIANAMDISSKLAVAAGILALQDAGIPLIATFKDTTTGSKLHTGWGLPQSMREETGIIFATAYPSIDSMASEVSRYLADKFRRKPMREFAVLVESLISRLKDPNDRAAVEHWYASNFHAYQERFGHDGPYEFSREFLLKVMPLGHTQLAQWIGVRGPGAQISAACASTTQAVGMAEDWIRLGRAKRVIVIAGDDVTSPNLREWIVTGFLTAGAATTTGVVSEAALPFDRRRHGMILGMGAAALVVEQGSKVSDRGMRPLTEILATQYENSAFHALRLSTSHVGDVMERLVSKAEKRFGIDRKTIASKALFMSHETYTPARGGSASAEVRALKQTFGSEASKIVVTNTKGYTGHSMGASIEDPVAIRALVTGQLPPIANYREADPELNGITLSRGGEHDLDFAIRLGAGFGSQIAMTLMKRVLRKGETRVSDSTLYHNWLREVSGQQNPRLEIAGNTLRVHEPRAVPTVSTPASPVSIPEPVSAGPAMPAAAQPKAAPAPAQKARAVAAPAPAVSEDEVRQTVVSLMVEKTGYPAEMLELDLDMEADLGIDTVKQAEFFGIIREKYSIPRQENLALKNYPTLRHVIRFVIDSTGAAREDSRGAAGEDDGSSRGGAAAAIAAPAIAPSNGASEIGDGEVKGAVIKLVSEKTGYPAEMLELDLDMEADLGIDTVKQAEIFGMVREHYSIPRQENLALKDYPTLRHLIQFIVSAKSSGPSTPAAVSTAVPRAAPAKTASPETFKRWVLENTDAPLNPGRGLKKNQPVLIIASKAEAAKALAKALEAVFVPSTIISIGAKDEQFSAAIAKAAEKTQGILYLPGVEWEAEKTLKTKTFEERYASGIRPLFLAAKAAQKSIQSSKQWIIAAANTGASPLAGALGGLTKALRKEFSGSLVRYLELDGKKSPKDLVSIVDAELSSTGGVEIIYRGSKRLSKRLIAKDIRASKTLSKTSTVLVTGGGQGLGAECAKEIARRFHCSIAIFGRTRLDPKAKEWAQLDAQGLKALKQDLWEKLKSEKTKKATPALLEKEFAPIAKAAALEKTLESIRAAGAKVAYHAVDLADGKAVAKTIKALGASWKPDLILHAAGIEESKLIADKTIDRFDAIFAAKAHGAVYLLGNIPRKKEQAWVFFSSVAGRFGNLGQTDYSAASDFLPKLAAFLQERGTRAVAVDLTAIADIGMATRGGVEQFLKSQGVDFMPPARAVSMILDEALGASRENEILLAGSLGKFDLDGLMPRGDTGRDNAPSTARAEQDLTRGMRAAPAKALGKKLGAGKPLFDSVIAQDAEAVATSKTFSLESDPWLADHSIAGTPYVAGVMGLELFAETAAKKNGRVPRGFKEVRFALPIKLLRQKPTTVRTFAANGEMRIESDFLTPQGIKLGGPRTHFTGTVLTDGAAREYARGAAGAEHISSRGGKFAVSPDQIYSAYFHGPSFQVLEGILSLNEKEVVAKFKRPNKALWSHDPRETVFHPMLIESAFQACGYRDLHFAKKMTLPDSIGSVRVFEHGECRGEYAIRCSFKGLDAEGRSVYDAFVTDMDRRVWVELIDYKMIPVS